MKTILPSEIKTVEQAQKFLRKLFQNGESFHPEDDASDIAWSMPKAQQPTKAQCQQLNKLMEDIYNLNGNKGNHATPSFDPCEFLLMLDPDYVKMIEEDELQNNPLAVEIYGEVD